MECSSSRIMAIAALVMQEENMNTAPSRSYNQQFGGARPQSERQTYQPQQQQYSTPSQPSGSRSSFGSASRSSAPSAPMNSNQSSFGGASRSSVPNYPMNSNQSSFGNASRSSSTKCSNEFESVIIGFNPFRCTNE